MSTPPHLAATGSPPPSIQHEPPALERVTHQGRLLAVIVSRRFAQPGIHFFTPPQLSQQLAFMSHPAGRVIQPHLHKPVPRSVSLTQETLFIRKGRLRVDFYNSDQEYLSSRILQGGDTLLLVSGGHGFEVLEDLEMLEVKQGPYAGDDDKVRFADDR